MIDEINKIDKALDELLVNLGGMVLRLAHPDVTRTAEARQALARSVNQFSTCALTSKDARVRTLAVELEATIVSDAAPPAFHNPPKLSVITPLSPGEAVTPLRCDADSAAPSRPILRLVVSR